MNTMGAVKDDSSSCIELFELDEEEDEDDSPWYESSLRRLLLFPFVPRVLGTLFFLALRAGSFQDKIDSSSTDSSSSITISTMSLPSRFAYL